MQDYINEIIRQHIDGCEKLSKFHSDDIKRMAEMCAKTFKLGGKILLCGNGGSAADCQHIAAEFVGRFETERTPLPAIALTVNTSNLTAIANDYGYAEVFSRQVRALGNSADLIIGISTSGNSLSIINALKQAKTMGAQTIGMTGCRSCEMDSLSICDLSIKVPSDITARIQEMHILVGHIVCGVIDHCCEFSNK